MHPSRNVGGLLLLSPPREGSLRTRTGVISGQRQRASLHRDTSGWYTTRGTTTPIRATRRCLPRPTASVPQRASLGEPGHTVSPTSAPLGVGDRRHPRSTSGMILSERTKLNIAGIHPSLQAVVAYAADLAGDDPDLQFEVTEGLRSDQQMMINWGKGRSPAECSRAGIPAHYAQPKLAKVTFLKHPLGSNHRKMKDGFGHAFDVYPKVNGRVITTDTKRCIALSSLFKRAAEALKVRIVWGGDWKTSKDYPHYELAQGAAAK